jgi:hypothetical protein
MTKLTLRSSDLQLSFTLIKLEAVAAASSSLTLKEAQEMCESYIQLIHHPLLLRRFLGLPVKYAYYATLTGTPRNLYSQRPEWVLLCI